MGCLARRTVAIGDATGYEQLSMRDPLIDPRAYLQQRVKLFTGVSVVFFICLLGLDFATPAPGEPLSGTTRLASPAVLASNAAVSACTRQGKRPAWACRLLSSCRWLRRWPCSPHYPYFRQSRERAARWR